MRAPTLLRVLLISLSPSSLSNSTSDETFRGKMRVVYLTLCDEGYLTR